MGGGVAITVVLLCVRNGDERIALSGSTVACALVFLYFVQQQKLAETALFKQLFTEFNQRYDSLNEDLAKIATIDGTMSAEDRRILADYFNLCAEEFLFYEEGYIPANVWRSWCNGMRWYLDKPHIRQVWDQEIATHSHYGLDYALIRRGSI